MKGVNEGEGGEALERAFASSPLRSKESNRGGKKTHDEGQDLSIAEMLDVWARKEKNEQRKMQEMQASFRLRGMNGRRTGLSSQTSSNHRSNRSLNRNKLNGQRVREVNK